MNTEIHTEAERFYESDADRFWDPFKPLAGRDASLLPLIPRNGGAALEYGFGAGSLLVALAPLFERIIAVEIADKPIERCKRRILEVQPELLGKIEFRKLSGTSLGGIEPATLDVVVCAAVIEHVFDPYALLDEFRRLARTGATLILTTPNLAYVKHRLRLLAGKLPRTGTDDPVERWRECGWDGGHLHYFTKETLATILNDCGWRPQCWLGSGERFPALKKTRQRFPTVFSGELIVVAAAG